MVALIERWPGVTGYDWGVIQKVEQSPTVARKKDLLFCALDGRCEVDVVGFLQLLTGLVTFVSSSQGPRFLDDLRCWSAVPRQPDSELPP